MASPVPCKSCDDVADFLGPFHLRQMPAARNDFDLRPRHQPPELARARDRQDPVCFAPNDLHRHVHPVQPFVEKRIVHARLPGEPPYGVAGYSSTNNMTLGPKVSCRSLLPRATAERILRESPRRAERYTSPANTP